MFKIIRMILPLCFLLILNACVRNNDSLVGQDVYKACKNKNAQCYSQFGKTYQVQSSAKNYQERGVASWYGRGFNKKRTSSGERYNMYKMTAAHKTLPLSTYVQVTNLRNGKQVIVKVNDRGPFASNRLIDLSYAAAKKLGMVGEGLAQVSVKAVSA